MCDLWLLEAAKILEDRRLGVDSVAGCMTLWCKAQGAALAVLFVVVEMLLVVKVLEAYNILEKQEG
jgi:hypothetical protein